jgi:hypothetical protein
MLYISYCIFLLILFIPTFISNSVPILVKNIPIIDKFNKPISKKLFWKNKTYRWFISGILFAIFFSFILYSCLDNINIYFEWVNFLNNSIYLYYNIVNDIFIAFLVWFLQWLWALYWDLMESYVKRKIWKKPWSALPFWDWVDYMIWSILVFSIIYSPTFFWILFLIFFAPFISLVANIISYLLWWKDVWY